MKNLFVALGAVAAAALCLHLLPLVPGATTREGRLSPEFWFNSFFMVLGFLVTTASVSPLVAWFLEWRSNRAWHAARANARERFATALSHMLSDYGLFLNTVAAGDPHGVSGMFLGQTHQSLLDFFDTYDSEQPVFNAEMHSAASNLRRHLLPFKRALESTDVLVRSQRAQRIYLGQHSLNDLRAVLDLPPLTPDSALSSHAYFAEHGQLDLDLKLDLHLGAGMIPVQRFMALQLDLLQAEWTRFLQAVPGGAAPLARPAWKLDEDADTQARLHAQYARKRIGEGYLAELVLARSLVEG